MFARLMGLKIISPAELHQLLPQNRVAIFDLNAPARWREAHVPGAVNLDPERFRDADLPADKTAALVFYCSNPWCRKAPNAARRALQLGHENVRVLAAGIAGWQSADLPVETAG